MNTAALTFLFVAYTGSSVCALATAHTAWNAALTYGGDIVAGDPLAGTLSCMISAALWGTAFELIRRNREASP